MNVFLDTNVVVDFMLQREQFFDDASVIFSMIEEGRIDASASVLSIINCAYLMKKVLTNDVMLAKVNALCNLLNITLIDKQQLLDAVNLKPYDFEDAVQYMSAVPSFPDVIITRDKRGFSDFDILVMSPSDFVEKAKQ